MNSQYSLADLRLHIYELAAYSSANAALATAAVELHLCRHLGEQMTRLSRRRAAELETVGKGKRGSGGRG